MYIHVLCVCISVNERVCVLCVSIPVCVYVCVSSCMCVYL